MFIYLNGLHLVLVYGGYLRYVDLTCVRCQAALGSIGWRLDGGFGKVLAQQRFNCIHAYRGGFSGCHTIFDCKLVKVYQYRKGAEMNIPDDQGFALLTSASLSGSGETYQSLAPGSGC